MTDQERGRRTTHDGYVDVRDVHSMYERRACPCCEMEWYYENGSSHGSQCPNCQSKPLYRRLAEKYGEHYYEAQQSDDSNVKPPKYHHRIPKAMAYEVSDILGWSVNHFHCMNWIWWALPEGARHSTDEEPSVKGLYHSDMVAKPPEGEAIHD